MPFRALAAICLSTLVTLAAAQNRELPARKLSHPPVIDGIVNEKEWLEADKSTGFTVSATGRPAEFPTTVYAGYDATNLYFAFVADDPVPALIRATEYRRQGNLEGDDRILLVISIIGSFRPNDFSQFEINPRGATTVRFAGGRAEKREWQGDWQAKSRVTEKGYEVEVAIPWSILRAPKSGKRDITINFGRYIPRRQEVSIWSDIGPSERFERSGIWREVEIPAFDQEAVIQALPYAIAGYDEDENGVANLGVDLRHQFENMTGLATINPDFKNVENAVLGIEFSRFERLANERRPFFVEGMDYLRFGGMSVQMFAPQRIRQIDFGTKIFGNLNANQSIGALLTSRFGHETASVFRFRQLLGRGGQANFGYVDYRNGSLHNGGLNVDAFFQGSRFGGDIVYGHTTDSVVGDGQRFDLDGFYSDGAFSASIGWQQISSDFLPRIGFAPRRGFRGISGHLAYGKEYSSGALAKMQSVLFFTDTEKEDGSGVYFDNIGIDFEFVTRNALSVGMGVGASNFQGAKDRLFGIGVQYPENNPFQQISGGYRGGEIDGERYDEISAGGNYRFASRLSIGGETQFVKLGKESSYQHIVGLNYELSEFRAVSGRLVAADGHLNWYLALRQSGNFGTEYFLILGDPNADTFKQRLILKVVTPFNLRL